MIDIIARFIATFFLPRVVRYYAMLHWLNWMPAGEFTVETKTHIILVVKKSKE